MHVSGDNLLHWLFLAMAIWILIAVAVPWQGFKRVWLPAFLTGFIMAYPINYFAVGYLDMWHFPKNVLTFLNTPFFLALSWFGSMVIFDQLVLVYSRFRIVFIFGFSLLTAAIFANAAAEGHLEQGRWSLAETYGCHDAQRRPDLPQDFHPGSPLAPGYAAARFQAVKSDG